MAWTEEKVKKLKEYWKKGYSTGEIGRMIGVSKNAVVGKAHRLGLDSRPSPIKPEKSVKNIKTAKTKVKETKAPEKGKAKPGDKEKAKEEPKKEKVVRTDGISLLELNKSSCRWPQGDPKEKNFSFCGRPCVEGRPYCAEHVREAYVGIERRGHKKDD